MLFWRQDRGFCERHFWIQRVVAAPSMDVSSFCLSSLPESVPINVVSAAQKEFEALVHSVHGAGFPFGFKEDGTASGVPLYGEEWLLHVKQQREDVERVAREESEEKEKRERKEREKLEMERREGEARKAKERLEEAERKAKKDAEERKRKEADLKADRERKRVEEEKEAEANISISTFSWVPSDAPALSDSLASGVSDVRDSVKARYGSLAQSMESRRLEDLHVYDEQDFEEHDMKEEEPKSQQQEQPAPEKPKKQQGEDDVYAEAIELAGGMNMEQLLMEVDWAEQAIVNRLNFLQATKNSQVNATT